VNREPVNFGSMAASWMPWWKAWEVASLAPMVIGIRTARMMMAGPTLSARDRREFHRMGQEKVAAFGESISAAAMTIWTVNLEIGALWARSLMSGAAFPAAGGGGGSMITGLTSRLAANTLAPVHRRVVANHRRLGRRPV
jgi:hypothetical protein